MFPAIRVSATESLRGGIGTVTVAQQLQASDGALGFFPPTLFRDEVAIVALSGNYPYWAV